MWEEVRKEPERPRAPSTPLQEASALDNWLIRSGLQPVPELSLFLRGIPNTFSTGKSI